jgi:hypothetical protein
MEQPMTNEEQAALDHAAFAAAFDEDMTTEQPDDFDIPAEDGADEQDGSDPVVTLDQDESEEELSEDDVEPAADDEAGEEAAEGEGEEAAEAKEEPAAEEEEEVLSEKDAQRKASWEGRLKAREAELARREAELKAREVEPEEEETPEPGESAEHEAAETPTQEEAEEVAEQIANKDVDEALSVLAEDFGDEFAKTIARLIEAKAAEIVSKTVDERVSKVSSSLDKALKSIGDDKAREHFEVISDVHPDFIEIGESPEFKAFIDAMPEDKAEKARGIAQGGSARQVIRLLNDFKKAQEASKPQADEDDPVVASAEGVRSRGLKIPEKPAASSDYAAAWDEF